MPVRREALLPQAIVIAIDRPTHSDRDGVAGLSRWLLRSRAEIRRAEAGRAGAFRRSRGLSQLRRRSREGVPSGAREAAGRPATSLTAAGIVRAMARTILLARSNGPDRLSSQLHRLRPRRLPLLQRLSSIRDRLTRSADSKAVAVGKKSGRTRWWRSEDEGAVERRRVEQDNERDAPRRTLSLS
jgi:hypothetical protein